MLYNKSLFVEQHSAANLHQASGHGTQPNPVAQEFIPRNMSAPNLNHIQHNGTFQNIPEFIPNRSLNRMNGMQRVLCFHLLFNRSSSHNTNVPIAPSYLHHSFL